VAKLFELKGVGENRWENPKHENNLIHKETPILQTREASLTEDGLHWSEVCVISPSQSATMPLAVSEALQNPKWVSFPRLQPHQHLSSSNKELR